jgi:uncharacterized protein DUF1707
MAEERENLEDPGAANGQSPGILASDNDRDAVVARLNEAVGEGRLTLQEFSERIGKVYAARTHGELAPLTADLPAIPPARGRAGPAGWCSACSSTSTGTAPGP